MGKKEIFHLVQDREHSRYSVDCNLCCTFDMEVREDRLRIYEVLSNTAKNLQDVSYLFENVLDSLQEMDCDLIFLIEGKGSFITYYYGICPREDPCEKKETDLTTTLNQCEQVFVANMVANFPDMDLLKVSVASVERLLKKIRQNKCVMQCEGVPGIIDGKENAIGTERFKKVAKKEEFILVLQARPIHANERKSVAFGLQQMIETAAELKDCTRTKNQSRTSETGVSVTGNTSCSTSHSRLSSEQIAFQLFNAQGTLPTIDADTVRTIEQAFFASDIDDLESLSDLYAELSRIRLNPDNPNPDITNSDVSRNQGGNAREEEEDIVSPEGMQASGEVSQQEEILRNQRIANQAALANRHIRNPFFHYWYMQNQRRQQREIARSANNKLVSIQSIQDEKTRPITNSSKESQELGEELPSNGNRGSSEVEGTNNFQGMENLENSGGFSFTNLNKTDTISRTIMDSSSRANQCSQTARSNCVHTDSVSYKVTNQGAKAWHTYLNDMAQTRLEYGYNRGIYLYTTTIYANDCLTVSTISSAWRGMHRYASLSRVPIKEEMVNGSSCRYQALTNLRIPLFYKKEENRVQNFTEDEVVANSAFSKYIKQPFLYGGNWISTKELCTFLLPPVIEKRT